MPGEGPYSGEVPLAALSAGAAQQRQLLVHAARPAPGALRPHPVRAGGLWRGLPTLQLCHLLQGTVHIFLSFLSMLILSLNGNVKNNNFDKSTPLPKDLDNVFDMM